MEGPETDIPIEYMLEPNQDDDIAVKYQELKDKYEELLSKYCRFIGNVEDTNKWITRRIDRPESIKLIQKRLSESI